MIIEKIKDKLKQNSVFFDINARIKSFQLVRNFFEISNKYDKQYAALDIKYDANVVINNFKKKFAKNIENTEKLNVLWIGANWDQDNTGFLQSLGNVCNLFYLVQPDGKYGFINSLAGFNKQVIQFNHDIILDTVKKIQATTRLDLVFGQMWANYIDPKTLNEIRKMGISVVNLAMDDRLPALWGDYKGYRLGSVGLKDGIDLVLTTAEECCKWYYVEDIPAIYWPLASNSEIFKPANWENKIYDVSFIGNNYGIRGDIIKGLKKAGIKVEAFGNGWENGYADSEMASIILAKSKIILGIATVGHTKNLLTLKLRDFDAPIAGALYITQRNPELYQYYEENKEIAFYDSIPDLIFKIKFYLKNEMILKSIAENARNRAVKDHTWEIRLKILLDLLKTK